MGRSRGGQSLAAASPVFSAAVVHTADKLHSGSRITQPSMTILAAEAAKCALARRRYRNDFFIGCADMHAIPRGRTRLAARSLQTGGLPMEAPRALVHAILTVVIGGLLLDAAPLPASADGAQDGRGGRKRCGVKEKTPDNDRQYGVYQRTRRFHRQSPRWQGPCRTARPAAGDGAHVCTSYEKVVPISPTCGCTFRRLGSQYGARGLGYPGPTVKFIGGMNDGSAEDGRCCG